MIPCFRKAKQQFRRHSRVTRQFLAVVASRPASSKLADAKVLSVLEIKEPASTARSAPGMTCPKTASPRKTAALS
jgi:hypothetical protein